MSPANQGHDVDTKLCPDCNAQLAKKIIKWPQVFEAYWCKACKMDFFREEVEIIPNKTITWKRDGETIFRVVKDMKRMRNYHPPSLRRKDD